MCSSDLEEVGEAKEIANLLAEVGEFEAASGGFGGDVEADEGAETRAVSVLEIGEVEDDAFFFGNEGANAPGKNVGGARHQLAVTANKDGVACTVFEVEGECGRSRWV